MDMEIVRKAVLEQLVVELDGMTLEQLVGVAQDLAGKMGGGVAPAPRRAVRKAAAAPVVRKKKPRRLAPANCSAADCGEPSYCKGVCRAHYEKARRPASSSTCSQAGCSINRYGRSPLCRAHYEARKSEPRPHPTKAERKAMMAASLTKRRAEAAKEKTAPPQPSKHGHVAKSYDNPTRAESQHDGKRNTACPSANTCLARASKLGWPALNCGLCLGTKAAPAARAS
jgi:hypothetical protein